MQVNAPYLVVVTVAGIFTPDVLHTFIRERLVQSAPAVDGVIFSARADEDNLVVAVCFRGVGEERFGRRTAVAAEPTNHGEQLGMPETDGRAMTAAHGV